MLKVKMQNKDGVVCECEKGQVETMKKAGWSKADANAKPKPVEKSEEDLAIEKAEKEAEEKAAAKKAAK